MKKLLLLALTIATSVQATEVGRVSNEAGGAIVFTSADCKEGGKVTYGYAAGNSNTIWGCATPMDGALFVKWAHGPINRYPYGSVEWSEEFKREFKKNRQSY